MPQRNSSHRQQMSVVSSVESDGVIIEALFRPESRDTALAIRRAGEIRIESEWRCGDVTYVPVRAANNLLKHGALLLPSDVTEYGNETELLREITDYISRYVSLPAYALGVCAAYILLTWLYDAFNEVPYLRFRGDYGTGKTRALMVVGSICYKAFFASGASTVSPIFHTLDTFKGTLIFDEADFRFSDEKAELVKILNNGNVKGFPVLRTQVTQNKVFDPRAFMIFGPKIVGMRRSYEDRALESRFLTIEMEPGHFDGVPINLPDAQKEEALALRNKLLLYRLRNRLSAGVDVMLADPLLEPRMNQILLPLLSIAPHGEIRASIRTMARSLQAGIVSERSSSVEGHVLSIVAQRGAGEVFSVSEVTKSFAEAYGREYERPITNRWIGSVLRRLGLALYKSNGVVVLVPGQQKRIAALLTRYGVESPKGPERRVEQSG